MLILPEQFFRSRYHLVRLEAEFFWSSFSGADAPNVFMPIMRPRFPMEIPERAALNFSFCLRVGRVEDALNGFIQHGVELRIGLLGREPFRKGPHRQYRKARATR